MFIIATVLKSMLIGIPHDVGKYIVASGMAKVLVNIKGYSDLSADRISGKYSLTKNRHKIEY